MAYKVKRGLNVLEKLKTVSTTDLNKTLWILSKHKKYDLTMHTLINYLINDVKEEYERRKEENAEKAKQKRIDQDIEEHGSES